MVKLSNLSSTSTDLDTHLSNAYKSRLYNNTSDLLGDLTEPVAYTRASARSTSSIATTEATDSVITNVVNADGTYTVAGWTWDSANAVKNASLISGTVTTFDSGFLNSEGNPLASQTVGSLLSNQSNFSVALGDSRTRSQIELNWGDLGLLNGVGNDFVIYENGDINEPEGYAVAVRIAGTDTFTAFRYEFYDTFESQLAGNPERGVLATAFDLSDFGLANGQFIDAIQIINLQPDDLVNGNGQGFIGTSGVSPLDPNTGLPFALDNLHPDITFVAGLRTIEAPPPSILKIAATGDFNRDGQPDIVLRNQATGENAIWLMNGTNITQVIKITSVSDPNWNIVGTGDFNNDLQIDIVWRNPFTGDNAVWLMNGTTFVEPADLSPVTSPDWNIVGTGDFNSDGQVDLLWRDPVIGDNALWLMNGTIDIVNTYIFPARPSSINIVGTGDFNADGKVDILFRDQATGVNSIVFMDGIFPKRNFISFAPVTDLNWRIVGTGDFNGDRQTDIVWENDVLDERLVWLMNGIQFVDFSYIS